MNNTRQAFASFPLHRIPAPWRLRATRPVRPAARKPASQGGEAHLAHSQGDRHPYQALALDGGNDTFLRGGLTYTPDTKGLSAGGTPALPGTFAPQRHRGHKDGELSTIEEILGAAIEEAWGLGPELVESPDEQGLCHELILRRIACEIQKPGRSETKRSESIRVIESIYWQTGVSWSRSKQSKSFSPLTKPNSLPT
jgi:hypothetical protein